MRKGTVRYKRMLIQGFWLTHLFTEGEITNCKCISGLPEGSKFCYSIPDVYYGIWIVIEHSSFPELKDCDEIPIMESPMMERII